MLSNSRIIVSGISYIWSGLFTLFARISEICKPCGDPVYCRFWKIIVNQGTQIAEVAND